uniref:50S ribosomal protein L23 n=1 Tax=Nephromyces sp. ex Molgula occidentalis TaxID=2544991 RepID=A0A5C1H7Z9_9APIC|nr:hypothetical protein [Nephromyces sp. ex Molgula occidentalis]
MIKKIFPFCFLINFKKHYKISNNLIKLIKLKLIILSNLDKISLKNNLEFFLKKKIIKLNIYKLKLNYKKNYNLKKLYITFK